MTRQSAWLKMSNVVREDSERTDLGEIVCARRKELKITQQELAQRANMSLRSITRLEAPKNRASTPQKVHLISIANVLQIPGELLFEAAGYKADLSKLSSNKDLGEFLINKGLPLEEAKFIQDLANLLTVPQIWLEEFAALTTELKKLEGGFDEPRLLGNLRRWAVKVALRNSTRRIQELATGAPTTKDSSAFSELWSGIFEQVATSVHATNLSRVDVSGGRNSMDRFINPQKDAICRGVFIERIFVIHSEENNGNALNEIVEVLVKQNQAGIRVGLISEPQFTNAWNSSNLKAATSLVKSHDFMILDETLLHYTFLADDGELIRSCSFESDQDELEAAHTIATEVENEVQWYDSRIPSTHEEFCTAISKLKF